MSAEYSSSAESRRIFDFLLSSFKEEFALPTPVPSKSNLVNFTGHHDKPYFPIPFKETETAAALKAIEASIAASLADLAYGESERSITINLEKTTAFLFQAYLARIGGLGKLDKERGLTLPDTDLHQAQSDPYRRMSANLYETATPNEYYHIHGSLDASTTLGMIGLKTHEPGLTTHDEIVAKIEPAVKKHTVQQLEQLNALHGQAGVQALQHQEFLKTPHGKAISGIAPWKVERVEADTPPCPLVNNGDKRILSGIKVLEMCRIIAGPVVTRILGEYGADVLKITGPHLSDVPFFQVDGNMGKHAAELDLRTEEGKEAFKKLLIEADVVVDGYRPGVLEKYDCSPTKLAVMAKERGKGFVYVNENCFGYVGEWSHRPGWQQIADCVSGVAWEQGKFMGLEEPVVPPFPISDYGTGCMGAIAALTGLYHRATSGGSWHGKASLLQYDLLLFRVGLLPDEVQAQLREQAGKDFLALRHAHSVDQISGTALRQMRKNFDDFVDNPKYLDHWLAAKYNNKVSVVKPVAEIDGLDVSFKRATRPNGQDRPSWDFGQDDDHRA
ncbi:hypothetical protein S7711_03449 [Stachybotrys chartarum IBT 7711]|uniref:Uncharacterized protein n=1 Tax=Stachybotrys chartarum (strain CBS 109288 / IBT 7711) TaxID=1280523 RepID=A0A084AFS6_STACB|nr:hypothetical protein S7711_03449 [Stachybotrys chartarum IBT 7711]